MPKLGNFREIDELGTFNANPYNPDYRDKYVIKIEKFNKSSWHENSFGFELGSLYPESFLQLFDYKVEKDIITRLYAKYNISFSGIAIGEEEYYSLICQYFNIIDLMLKHKFQYETLHKGNLAVTFTDQEYMLIGRHNIPTFGRFYKPSTYGQITDTKFSPKTELWPSNAVQIYNLTVYFRDYTTPFKDSLIKSGLAKLRKMHPEEVTPPHQGIEIILYGILYFEKWKKLFGVNTECSLIKHLPDKDYRFIARNWDNPKTLIEYFANKMKIDAGKFTDVRITDDFSLVQNDGDKLFCICEPGEKLSVYPNSTFFSLYDGSKMIGFFTVNDVNYFKNAYKELWEIAQDPKHKGLYLTALCGDSNYRNVTKPMLAKLIQWAKPNWDYIVLEVSEYRPWLEVYYTKLGFKVIGKLGNFGVRRLNIN